MLFCLLHLYVSRVSYSLCAVPDMRSSRGRRDAGSLPTRIRCGLSLVADYRFFKNMGNSDRSKAINYVVSFVLFFCLVCLNITYKYYIIQLTHVLL